jgi:3-dehydroquinate synthase
MEIVPVRLKANSYSIHIGKGILPRLGELLRPFCFSKRVVLVSDPRIDRLYGQRVATVLKEAGFLPLSFLVPTGERNKSLTWASRLYDFLIQERADRHTPIFALGGGVIGDLAGFVAATYMRGVPFLQLPTSLLAQIDSSVGGKVAVNHPRAKNMIGVFYQPRLVLIDIDFLQTLSKRELRAGLGEVIKYGVIADAAFFSFLEENLQKILRLDPVVLPLMIRRCCEIKAAIVGQDEREEGMRAVLNYGHTIGHALEVATHFRRYRHGEAVAAGMEAAGRISHLLGLWSATEASRQRALLKAAKLPIAIPVEAEKLLKLLCYDKKVREGKAHFVLTRAIGDAIIRPLSDEELILKALNAMGQENV